MSRSMESSEMSRSIERSSTPCSLDTCRAVEKGVQSDSSTQRSGIQTAGTGGERATSSPEYRAFIMQSQ